MTTKLTDLLELIHAPSSDWGIKLEGIQAKDLVDPERRDFHTLIDLVDQLDPMIRNLQLLQSYLYARLGGWRSSNTVATACNHEEALERSIEEAKSKKKQEIYEVFRTAKS